MDNSEFKIAILGLGIIGGSMAYALRGFRNAFIFGCDKDPDTRAKVLKAKAVDAVSENPAPAIQNADLVIFCTYPHQIPKQISENRDFFKKGAIITDVCGVKTKLTHEIVSALPPWTEYVGGHPMAGKETHGFDSASPDLFDMCGYIITPVPTSSKRSIDTIVEMAKYIGAARITQNDPKNHDRIIAYTSDLMHISASALCLEYNKDMNKAYTAGAFRDCTRVANINPQLWSQLFLDNRSFILPELSRYIDSLEQFKAAIETVDKDRLEELLSKVRTNKLAMQNMEPEDYI